MRVQVSWKAGLVLALATLMASSGCLTGTETEDNDATNTFVKIVRMESEAATSTGTEAGTDLFSDVCITSTGSTTCTVINDTGVVTMTSEPKDQQQLSSRFNDIQFTRYRVTYIRADGRNVPGVDVPYAFDGVTSFLLPNTNSEVSRSFTVVRQQAKLEPPLVQLRNTGGFLGGAKLLSTLAQIDFYGTDVTGREIKVTGYLNVTFGDFGD
jgi:hypothetical protein